MDNVKLALNAKAEHWETVREALISFSRSHQLTSNEQYYLLLICEEWFFNIVNHGFPHSHYIEPNQATIEIEVKRESSNRVEIAFVDEGIPFNPFEKQLDEKVTASIDQQLGGLGLFFIVKLLESYKYVYLENKNKTIMYYSIGSKED